MKNITALLTGYHGIIEFPVKWGEMDALGHVNNVAYFRYCESARIEYFSQIHFMNRQSSKGVGPILASTSCRYKHPLFFPDTVSVGSRITDLKKDRFIMEYLIVSHKLQRVAAKAEALVVSYDYEKQCKVALPTLTHERIRELESHLPA
jgi:acyl-CoA thioester hydrolase